MDVGLTSLLDSSSSKIRSQGVEPSRPPAFGICSPPSAPPACCIDEKHHYPYHHSHSRSVTTTSSSSPHPFLLKAEAERMTDGLIHDGHIERIERESQALSVSEEICFFLMDGEETEEEEEEEDREEEEDEGEVSPTPLPLSRNSDSTVSAVSQSEAGTVSAPYFALDGEGFEELWALAKEQLEYSSFREDTSKRPRFDPHYTDHKVSYLRGESSVAEAAAATRGGVLSTSQLGVLPDDQLQMVASWLPVSSLLTLRCVCRDLGAKISLHNTTYLQGPFRNIHPLIPNLLKLTALTELDLDACRLEDHDMEELAQVLPRLRLTTLCLSGNAFGIEGMKALCQSFIRSNNNIKSSRSSSNISCVAPPSSMWKVPLKILDLSGNDLGHEGLRAFADALVNPATFSALGSLRLLNLSGNNMNLPGIAHLARAMKDGTSLMHLQSLLLAHNGFFGVEGMRHLTAAWREGRCPALEELDLRDTHIVSGGGKELANALRSGMLRLKALDIAATGIDGSSLRDILEALEISSKPPSSTFSSTTSSPPAFFNNHPLKSLSSASSLSSKLITSKPSLAQPSPSPSAASSSALTVLDLSRNRDLGRQGGLHISQYLRGHSGRVLRTLNLSGGVTALEGFRELASTFRLGACPLLEELDISENVVGVEAGPTLMLSLRYVPKLVNLELYKAGVGIKGGKALARVIREGGLRSLERLDVSCNFLHRQGCQELALAIHHSQHKSLKVLNLGNNQIEGGGMWMLASALQQLEHLTVLGLSNNPLTAEDVTALARGFPPSLEILEMAKNHIDVKGGMELARRLSLGAKGGLPRLKVLNLADNYIATVSQDLLAALIHCPRLQVLNVSRNTIGDVGVKQLATALQQGAGEELISLDLSWNSISYIGAAPLFDALKAGGSPCLQHLRLFWNYIGDTGASALAQALHDRSSSSLRALDLSENGICGQGAKDLAYVLSTRPQYIGLQLVNLSNNPLGPEAGRGIVASFQEGTCPLSLNLANTHISRSELKKFALVLKEKGGEVIIM